METVQFHLFKARVGGGNRYFLIKERSIYQIKVVAILYYESPPSAISRPLFQICFSTIRVLDPNLLTSRTLRTKMGGALIRCVLGMYSACTRNGIRRVADQTPKHSRSIPKRCERCRRFRTGPHLLPQGFSKQCQGFPKDSRRFAEHPKSVPNVTFCVQILEVLKFLCRRFFLSGRSRICPKGFQKGRRRVPNHPEGN